MVAVAPSACRTRRVCGRTRADGAARDYGWLLAGTVLMVVGNGRWVVPLATWLFPLCLLRFARTGRASARLALLSLAVAGANLVAWQGAVTSDPASPLQYLPAAYTPLLVLPFAVDRLLVRQGSGFVETLVFPAAYVVLEYGIASLSPMGAVGMLAYTQYPHNLPLLQLVALTGMWGVTFLIAWFGSVVSWAVERRDGDGTSSWPGLRAYALVLGAVVLLGGLRLAFAPAATTTARVAGLHVFDLRRDGPALWQAQRADWAAFRSMTAAIHERLIDASRREARAGAQVVLWAEIGAPVAQEDEAGLVQRGQDLARTEGIYLGMALDTLFRDPARSDENKMLLVSPGGEVVLTHLKFGAQSLEGFLAGDGVLRTVSTPVGVLSAAICRDLDFPGPLRQAGRNGVDLLLVPSADWREIDPFHADMAALRGIENGVSLVRQTANGLSLATDPYGRTLAALDHFSTAGDWAMVAEVPTNHTPTLYPLVGDLFAWACVVGLVLLAGDRVLRRNGVHVVAPDP